MRYRRVLSSKNYAKVRVLVFACSCTIAKLPQLNKYVMLVIFFIPLLVLTSYESLKSDSTYLRTWFGDNTVEDDGCLEAQNPEVDEDGLKISKVDFQDIIKSFPNILLVSFYSFFHECMTLTASSLRMK